jgi:hypothetical protein
MPLLLCVDYLENLMSKTKIKLDSLVQEPQRPRTSLEVQQILNRYLKSDCMQFYLFQLERFSKELDQARLNGEPKFYFEEEKNAASEKYRLYFSVAAYSTEPEPLFRIQLSADTSGQPYAGWRAENLPWTDAPQCVWKHGLDGRAVAAYLTTLSYYMTPLNALLARNTGEHLSKYYGRVMAGHPDTIPNQVHFSVYTNDCHVHVETYHDGKARGTIDIFAN